MTAPTKQLKSSHKKKPVLGSLLFFSVFLVSCLLSLVSVLPADAARAGVATPVVSPPIVTYNTTSTVVSFTGTAGPGDTVSWRNNLTLATGGVTPTHYFDCYAPWWDPCAWICDSLDSQTWSVTINVNAGANLIDFWTSTDGTLTQVTVNRDNTAPTITIINPAPPSYSTGSSTVTVSGTAADNLSGVASVRWSNGATGLSGTASGTTSWTVNNIQLSSGLNPIVMTATDVAGNVSNQAILNVTTTFVPPAGSTFAKVIGNSSNQNVTSMKPTSDGGYIIGGQYGGASWAFLTKTDSSGAVTWTQELHGPYASTTIYSVIQTSDGGYATTGTANEWVGNNNQQLHIAKYTATGSLQWFRMASGANAEQGNAIIQTSDSGYMVVGQTNSFGAGNFDIYMLKYDSAGTLQWSRTYGGTLNDYAYDIKPTSDGGYILVGYTYPGYTSFYKFDASWALTWSKGYIMGGSNASVQQTSDSGYIAVAGNSMIKLNSSGDRVWAGYFSGANFYSVTQTSSGGYAAVGSFYNGTNSNDIILSTFDGAGVLQWSRAIGGTGAEYGYAVSQMSDGGYAIAGYTNSFGAGGNDIYLIRTNTLGSVSLCGAVAAYSTTFTANATPTAIPPLTTSSPATVASTPTSSVVALSFSSVGGCAMDVIPPVRSGGYPMSPPLLAWSASNPRNITMGLTTDEAADCKYDTTDKAWISMLNSFTASADGKTHTRSVSISNGGSYTYYVRCRDRSINYNVNTDSYVISFQVWSNPPQAGACATPPNGGTYPAPGPTGTLCTAFDPADPPVVLQSGSQWTWICSGRYTGSPQSCSATVQVNGQCGSSVQGGSFASPPATALLCDAGTPTQAPPPKSADQTQWLWRCNGSGGGSQSSQCWAYVSTNGICGVSVQGLYFYSSAYPTSGYCDSGTYVFNFNPSSGNGYRWEWDCLGVRGGADETNCYAYENIDGVCRTPPNGSTVGSAPSSNMCSVGDPSVVPATQVGMEYHWDCIGYGMGNPDNCVAYIPDTTPPDFLNIQVPITLRNPLDGTSASHYTNAPTVSFGGTAADFDGRLDRIDWINLTRGVSGTSMGTTSWFSGNIDLVMGVNEIEITAYDAAGNLRSSVVSVTYEFLAGAPPRSGNFAYSENTGWLSFSCAEDGSCTASNYGLTISPDPVVKTRINLTGYAWSGDEMNTTPPAPPAGGAGFGWLRMDPPGPYPIASGNTQAPAFIDLSFNPPQLWGWARFCAGAEDPVACSGGPNADSGTWDGWVQMRGDAPINFGPLIYTNVSAQTCDINGWMWGATNR
jgi:hypothetical protein